jgi:hypothetical protein
LEKIDRTTGDREIIEIYDSLSNARLESETREEYLNRRMFLKMLEKKRKKTWNLEHVSSYLIPKFDSEGKVEKNINGDVRYVGKTKGQTFVKNK